MLVCLLTSISGLSLLCASPAEAADLPIAISINPETSPLYVYEDTEYDPPYPSSPATALSGLIRNCPAGEYTRQMSLTQDGYSAQWTVGSAKGAWEWFCTGADQPISMGLTNASQFLHPGEATATIELLDSSNTTVIATVTRTVMIPTSAPTEPRNVAAATTSSNTATVNWVPPLIDGGSVIAGYRVSRDAGTAGGTGWSTTVTGTTRTLRFANLRPGSTYSLSVAAINGTGSGPAASVMVTAGTPGKPIGAVGTATSTTTARLTWSPPATPGASTITGYRVGRDGGRYGGATWSTTVSAATRSLTFNNLSIADSYKLSVAAINSYGTGSSAIVQVVAATAPVAPAVGTATAGSAGGPITATATWRVPTSDGGAFVNGYVVRALRMSASGSVLSTTISAVQSYDARALAMRLPSTGNYRFTVQATNSVGSSPQSARSNLVAGR